MLIKNYLPLFIGITLLSAVFSSCNPDENDEAIAFGYSYFPMQVGDSLIYDVHVYNKDINEDDSSYQLLERVESTFEDNEGRTTFRLERYIRPDENSPWNIYKVWTANVTTTAAEKKEDNITYVKLIFPLSKNLQWNGDSKNINASNNPDDYKISELNEPLVLGSLTFDSSLTVTQRSYDYGFESSLRVEKYAAGTGMVYKEITDSLQGGSLPKAKIYMYSEKLIYSNK